MCVELKNNASNRENHTRFWIVRMVDIGNAGFFSAIRMNRSIWIFVIYLTVTDLNFIQ